MPPKQGRDSLSPTKVTVLILTCPLERSAQRKRRSVASASVDIGQTSKQHYQDHGRCPPCRRLSSLSLASRLPASPPKPFLGVVILRPPAHSSSQAPSPGRSQFIGVRPKSQRTLLVRLHLAHARHSSSQALLAGTAACHCDSANASLVTLPRYSLSRHQSLSKRPSAPVPHHPSSLLSSFSSSKRYNVRCEGTPSPTPACSSPSTTRLSRSALASTHIVRRSSTHYRV